MECKHCGSEFESDSTKRGPKRSVCDKCRSNTRLYTKVFEQICSYCGNTFSRPVEQKHCSYKCRDAANRKLLDVQCVVCGKLFRPRSSKQKCCGKRCGRIKEAQTKRKYWPVCLWCELEFAPKKSDRIKFCCRSHYYLYLKFHRRSPRRGPLPLHDKTKAERPFSCTMRAHRIASRMRQFIFERDNWICGLCGRRCLRSAKVPHLLAATADHIVPITRWMETHKNMDGVDDPSNLQCAHFKCNSLKMAEAKGQMRLALSA